MWGERWGEKLLQRFLDSEKRATHDALMSPGPLTRPDDRRNSSGPPCPWGSLRDARTKLSGVEARFPNRGWEVGKKQSKSLNFGLNIRMKIMKVQEKSWIFVIFQWEISHPDPEVASVRARSPPLQGLERRVVQAREARVREVDEVRKWRWRRILRLLWHRDRRMCTAFRKMRYGVWRVSNSISEFAFKSRNVR